MEAIVGGVNDIGVVELLLFIQQVDHVRYHVVYRKEGPPPVPESVIHPLHRGIAHWRLHLPQQPVFVLKPKIISV